MKTISDDVLVQFRIPRDLAHRIQTYLVATGQPLNHFAKEVLSREVTQPEFAAWQIEKADVGKLKDEFQTWEYGSTNPHFLFVPENFGPNFVVCKVRGGPHGGKPKTNVLSLGSFRGIFGTEFGINASLLIRGNGFWTVENVFAAANDEPMRVGLKFVKPFPTKN